MKNHLVRLLLACLLFCAVHAHAELVVVVAANSPIGSLSRDQVVSIFLGKYRMVGDTPVRPLEVSETALKNEFYSSILSMSEDQYNAYWLRMVFTGKGFPPKEASTVRDAKLKLSGNGSLITYAPASAVDASLKVVYREGK